MRISDWSSDVCSSDLYRKISYVHLRPEDLAAEIGIPEEKLRQAYERRIDEFVVPETRSVRQIVLPDEEHAKQAYEMLSNGRDVFTVASELAKQGADATDLGKIANADLPVEQNGRASCRERVCQYV